MKPNLRDANRPWSSRAQQEVPKLRGAITKHLDEPMITSSAAPMMGELLTRLEGFSDPGDAGDLREPPIAGGREPMSQAEATSVLHDACATLRQRLLSGGDDAKTSDNLQAMVEVIDDHLSMKSEVLARAASDPTPG